MRSPAARMDAIFPLASVVAMLLVLVALVSLVNMIFGAIGLGVHTAGPGRLGIRSAR